MPTNSCALAAKRYRRASVLRSSVGRVILVAILLTWPAPALAQQSEALRRLRTNIHQDMTTCIAAKTAATYAKARDDLLYKSILLGKQLGIPDEEAKFRLGAATDEMMQLIKSDCVNLASLLSKHLDKCTAVAADPLNPLKQKDSKD
jgi:hypothetical protein